MQVAFRLWYASYMGATQLAIRFNERQMQTLDALASERHSTRSAVVKALVDEAEKSRVSALYTAAYEQGGADDIDHFGDLGALHAEAEIDRIAARKGEASW
jgi:hypothetical protein